MSESVSPEEEAILRGIKQKQAIVNQIFKDLDIKKADVLRNDEQKTSEQEQNTTEARNNGSYLQKYADYSIEKIRKNYDEAFLPFKWYQLPFCRKVVYEKMLFCIPANVFILTAYVLWKKWGQDSLPKFTIKGSLKMYLGLTAVTWIGVFAQSLIFQPYCDINSQHYNNKITNFQLAAQLKKQYLDYYPKSYK